MKIALLSNRIDENLTQHITNEFGSCLVFKSINKLFQSNNKFDSIFLSGFPGNASFLLIQKLRQSDLFYNTPVFLDRIKNLDNLVDGCFSDSLETRGKLKEINKFASELGSVKGDNVISWKTRFLTFLYCRPALTLVPDFARERAMYYYYPLIDLFYTGKENYYYWLDDLVDQQVLKKNKLIDRLFCCPYCFSAHLKFTDHCPYCNSINIRLGDFLHCFTCGLVAPQEDFLKNDRLICPRCSSHLLHIGEDYDRPLESGVCMDCGEYHVDSKVIAFCVDCKKSVPTDRLNKRVIYELSLSEIGRNHVRFNSVEFKPIFEDSLKFVMIDYFYSVVDWFKDMQLRYKDEVFSILGIRMIFNSNGLSYELTVEFGKLIKKIFRNTDFCARSDNGYLWFLLPKTDKKKLNLIKKRLDDFVNNLDKEESENFETKIVTYTSNANEISNVKGKFLIGELASKL